MIFSFFSIAINTPYLFKYCFNQYILSILKICAWFAFEIIPKIVVQLLSNVLPNTIMCCSLCINGSNIRNSGARASFRN